MPDVSLKRCVDLAVAGVALVGAAPVLAVAAAAIRVESPGPVLFRHLRVGREKRAIHTLKLRTMVDGAERRGPSVTAAGDARITRVGRWLRKTKLDELPQLWNVIRGDMSLVGPRPEVPRYVELYPEAWQSVFTVRPGLTDLASLTFRDEEALLGRAHDRERAYREVLMPMKLALALEGIERSSLVYDLSILGRTALAVVRGHDARQRSLLAEALRRIERLNDEDATR